MLRHRARLSIVAATTSLLLVGFDSDAMDLPSQVARTDTAVEATVFLVPPMLVFRTSLDEARMQAQACRYATSDPAAIRAVAALLKAADVTANVVYQRPDLREGVYLSFADGSQLKFLLQDNNGGRSPVAGVAETSSAGTFQNVGVTANETLATDLRRWAAASGGIGAGSPCNRRSAIPVESR